MHYCPMRSISPPLRRPAAASPRRRVWQGTGVGLAVLVAHGLLFTWLMPAPRPADGHASKRAASAIWLVQHLPPVPAPAAVAAADAPKGAAAAIAARPNLAGPGRVAAQVGRAPATVAAATAVAVQATPSLPDAANTSPSAADDVPVYATRLPPPVDLHYELQRGGLIGVARLHWRRRGDAYELSFETELPGRPAQGATSRGVIDADGVAPVRHVDRRRSRDVRAANFRREAGLISFSGPQQQYPLRAGAQDRLSWMVQLPAIIEADARLARPGTVVTLFVVGTAGDAEAWRFEVQGREALELPAGAVADALHLRRDAQRPYDTRVEVWLDPARQHLPVRAVFTTVPGGGPTELTLSRSETPPL
jgi:hypothetical protein